MKKRKKYYFIFAVMLLLLLLLLSMFVCIIPKDAMSKNDIFVLRRHLKAYYLKHGIVPNNLSVLLKQSGSIETTDAWNNAIEYKRELPKVITLISAGIDGKYNTNDDLIGKFNIEDDLDEWIISPSD